jgi:hypothetical protein
LQLQGQDSKDVDAIGQGDPSKATGLKAKEIALLEYVKLLTLEPAKVRDADVWKLRKAGWTDEQIFEATFDTALFAFFNRMADGYGLDFPSTGWHPPTETKPELKQSSIHAPVTEAQPAEEKPVETKKPVPVKKASGRKKP